MKNNLLTGLAIGLIMLFGNDRSSYASIPYDAIVINDNFSTGNLDQRYSIALNDASSWSYQSDSNGTTVTDIVPTTNNQWAAVNLTQQFTPLTDFNIDFKFSWDFSGNLIPSRQNLLVQMYDESGVKFSEAGYSGSKLGRVGTTDVETDINTMPIDGSAEINVQRFGNDINIFWDNILLVSGTESSHLSRIDLVFSYFKADDTSTFGSETPLSLRVEGNLVQPVPLPPSLWLFGSSLVGMIGLTKRSRASVKLG